MIYLDDIKKDPRIMALIEGAHRIMQVRGYTEHGLRHVGYVSQTAGEILRQLDYDDRSCEIAAIAGWVHDIGNSINRLNHGISGAQLLFPILLDIGMDFQETLEIISAVGNHEEQNGMPVSAVSSALIIADKSDAHRTRVNKRSFNLQDIHDRVNYSIKKNWLNVDKEDRIIRFGILMDDSSSVMEYMQIFLSRMVMCEQAAAFLGCTFDLEVNGVVINNQTKMKEKL
ncbi:MAG: phosphohydrolase [Christensenellales bacterium]|jgi:metal-dependent HD superfamily phosphatase/phosphodiesterase